MSSKIAFTGAPGTGKSKLQEKAISMFPEESTYSVGNNTAKRLLNIVDTKYTDWLKESEELELGSAFHRRVEMLSIDPDNNIVADEWALNELANIMVKMNTLEKKIKMGAQILGSDGKPIFNGDQGQMIILQSVFQVLLNQVAFEQGFWDFMYYTPIYTPGDDILDEDGVAPKDRLHQKEVDLAIINLIDQLKLNVVRLPVNREESFKFLEDESRKWKK